MHHPRHIAMSNPSSIAEKLGVFLVGPLAVVLLLYALSNIYHVVATPSNTIPTFSEMIIATLYTLVRIGVAYVLAVVIGVPLALLATASRTLERIFLPIFDILQSIPILAFFPVVIVLFIQFDFLEGAAIFILFLNMLWNIVFNLVGGLKIIPKDVTYAAKVFGVSGFSYIRRLAIPAIFPQLVTGSILAVAEGWNLVIVAEAIHTYVPNGTSTQDLVGIGSMLVAASANAQNSVFIMALLVMVLLIAFFNLFVWQKLLHYAQRFRFD